jgi:hypothetical protein
MWIPSGGQDFESTHMSVTPIFRNILEAMAFDRLAALRSPPPW